MNAQILSLQADFVPATAQRHVSLVQAPARWLHGFFLVCSLLMFSAPSAFAQVYQWGNWAGMSGGAGSTDGTGNVARFSSPSSVAVDANGNVYVSDTGNETIRKVTPSGVVSTLAGQVNVAGGNDGPGGTASFNRPAGLAVDSSGNLYVADYASNTLRMVTPSGVVSTLAGIQGLSGHTDGPGSSATFNGPSGMAVDASGYIYVTDSNNNKLRRLAPDGTVATFVASPSYFVAPAGVAVDGSGNIYVADQSNHCIRMVTPAGVISTLAGLVGNSGSNDGTVSTARFYRPGGVAVDSDGNVYVADTGNSTLRKVTPGGVVSTVAGLAFSKGSSDGTGSAAQFNAPGGLAVDSSGNLYVADAGNHTLRKVTPGGVVTTLAGQASRPGSTDGTGSAARFYRPCGVAADGSGNVYIADSGNNTLRKTTSDAVVSTLAGLAGSTGTTDGTGSAARFNGAPGVAVDGSGSVYIADKGSHTLRKVTPGGVVSTLAGLGLSSGSSDGTGSAARFRNPSGVAVDGSGNVYVADQANHTIRKVTSGGVVTTLAGLAGSFGSSDGTGSAARFYYPTGVAVDGSGNVYVADQFNNTLRMVTPGGVVSTLAGLAGSSGSSDGTGSAARFSSPTGVAVDGSGNVYVADFGNSTLRKVTPAGVVTTIGGTAGATGGADGIGAAASFNQVQGVAVSSSGVVFVADTSNNRISMGIVVPAPILLTASASSITSTGATLNGTLNANGLSANVSFDYGLTTAYGTNVTGTPTSVTGSSTTAVSTAVSGLSPGTTYHFRVNGTSSGGTTSGSDQTFTTASTPTSWRQQWYSTASNTGSAADNADPYHTGVPNLVAFALFGPNQSPAQVAASRLPQPQMVGGNYVFSFTEPAGVSGVSYGAQYTTSLSAANWQPMIDTGTGTQHVFIVPIGSNSQIFIRLTLTNLNP